jgi:tubulin monoglycylase TTLL3/8
MIFKNYKKILDYCGVFAENRIKKTTWVIQKYIENPMLIVQRKFDFRVWVVVTAWNPLKVYIYDLCYLRFGSQNYGAENLNLFSHLTNNSIQK